MEATKVPTAEELRDMPPCRIATIVSNDWERPYFGAVPYLEAMACLQDMGDRYGVETGRDIVPYFISNARTWKGEVARLVKAELKRRLA